MSPRGSLKITPTQIEVAPGYSSSFMGHGGTSPYTFALAENASGGAVDPVTGEYSAGPNVGVDVVRVTDAAGATDDARVTVVEPLQLTSPDAAVVKGTTTMLQATGGAPPYAFAFAAAGNISDGIVVRETGEYTPGQLPDADTATTDTIEVTDDAGRTASITIEVKPALQIRVPEDELPKVQLGSPPTDPAGWETWQSGGTSPPNPSATLEITVATGVEVTLEVVGGAPDFSVADETRNSGGQATPSPEPGKRTFTYKAGLSVGGNRRSTDTLTITDGQSTPNEAAVTVTVTESFEDLAALASNGSFKLPFVAYRTWHPFVGFSFHDGLLPSPTGAVPADKLPCIGGGFLHQIGLQSLPSKGHAGSRGPVTAPGRAYLMGRGSDVGFVVFHFSFPPTNYLLPLVILLGESKSLFGSSSVKLPCWSLLGGEEECDTACAFPIPWLPLVGLNLGCSDDFPLPLDLVVAPSTILVGMGWMDLLAAALDIALEYAVAGIMKAFGAGKGQISEKLAKRAKKGGKEVAEKAVKEAVEKVSREAAEQAAQQAAAKEAKQLAKRAAKKAAKEAANEAANEAAAKASREAAEKAAREATEKAAKEAANEAAAKATKEAAEKASKQAADEAAEQAAKEAAEREAKHAALRRGPPSPPRIDPQSGQIVDYAVDPLSGKYVLNTHDVFLRNVNEVNVRSAKEAAAKASKEAAEKASKQAADVAAKQAAKESAAKAAKESAQEAAEKASKEAAEAASKEATAKAAKESAREAAEKASKEAAEAASKEATAKAAKQAAETKRLGLKSLDPKKVAKKQMTPEQAYDKLTGLPVGKKTMGVVKGVIEDVLVEPALVEYPLKLAKGGIEHAIGLEEFDEDSWWEFSPFAPLIVRAVTGDSQAPAGDGWWFD